MATQVAHFTLTAAFNFFAKIQKNKEKVRRRGVEQRACSSAGASSSVLTVDDGDAEKRQVMGGERREKTDRWRASGPFLITSRNLCFDTGFYLAVFDINNERGRDEL